MFDQFTVIIYAFTGKLKNAPTLRKYFWVFLVGGLMALIILAYNAFMSLNFYRQLLERFTPWDSLFLPILTTISIAITVYLLMSGITGTILDYISGNTFKTKGHEPLFIATILVLIGFLALDIYANLKGVDYVSELTTEKVEENNSEDVFASVNEEIAIQEQKLKSLLAGEYGGYGWMQDGTYHLNNSGKRWQRALAADITKLRDQQSLLVSSAIDSHQQDKNRYTNEIEVKRKSHIRLVWFAYPIALLICFIVQHYVQRATDHVEPKLYHRARGNAMPPSSSDQVEVSEIYPSPETLSAYEIPGNATPGVTIPNLSKEEAAFLKKWKEAVDLILQGYSNKEVMELYTGPQGQVRGTTIQKIKTVLRVKGVLPEYQAA